MIALNNQGKAQSAQTFTEDLSCNEQAPGTQSLESGNLPSRCSGSRASTLVARHQKGSSIRYNNPPRIQRNQGVAGTKSNRGNKERDGQKGRPQRWEEGDKNDFIPSSVLKPPNSFQKACQQYSKAFGDQFRGEIWIRMDSDSISSPPTLYLLQTTPAGGNKLIHRFPGKEVTGTEHLIWTTKAALPSKATLCKPAWLSQVLQWS